MRTLFLIVVILLSLPCLPVSADEERKPTLVITEDTPPNRVSATQLVRDHVREHMDLHKGGLRYQFKIDDPRNGHPPLKFEIRGPFHGAGEPGFTLVCRF